MNEYTIADLCNMHKQGRVSVEYMVKITDEMLEAYAGQFERISPLHTDDNYARSQGFAQRIVPQLLVVSQLLPMVELHLPGKYGLGLGADKLVFKKPVYVGETLRFRGELAKVSRAAKLIVLAITASSEHGDTVIECQWKAKVLK